MSAETLPRIDVSTLLREAETVCAVHRGALGDFLQTWPVLCSLAEHLPASKLVWAGRTDRQLWATPLGLQPCPPKLRQAVESIPSVRSWPETLRTTAVIWFGLQKSPAERPFPQLLFLPGILPGHDSPPREIYAQGIERAGVPIVEDWLVRFRELFRLEPEPASDQTTVLLFPGAGHPLRCWPLDSFLHLADWLDRQGLKPCFVLGPAEMERHVRVQDFEHCCLWDLQDLQTRLCQARLAVGNDTGPLHLAGYLGLPVVSLFGPSSAAQWAPVGARVVSLNLSCSPCSRTGQVSCQDPACMTGIGMAAVQQAVSEVLNQTGQSESR